MHVPRAAAPLIALALAAALAASGCGAQTVTTTDASAPPTVGPAPHIHFAKTKLVLHLGLAFGAFHRYISKPLAAGAFVAGEPRRLRAIVQAGAAALFAAHELRMAREDALGDSRLRPLAEPVERLLGKLDRLASALKRGVLDPGAMLACANAVRELEATSSSLGAAMKEIVPRF